jgi:hypothetical protein
MTQSFIFNSQVGVLNVKRCKKTNSILSKIKLNNITLYFIKNTTNKNKKKNNWPRYFIV